MLLYNNALQKAFVGLSFRNHKLNSVINYSLITN